MGKMGKLSIAGMKKLQQELKIRQDKADAFAEACIKALAARLLAAVVERTPAGDGSDGTLRSGWTVGEIRKNGSTYEIEIVNNAENDKGVPYASYVEYGHRTKNGGWTEGRFMLTVSERELRRSAPKVLENKLSEFLKGVIK